MRGAFWAVWLLAGCRTTHTLEASQQADTELHREVQSGPEHIVMTVDEFGELCDPKDAGRPDMDPAFNRGSAITAPAPGNLTQTLVRRTVTVTDRGPSLETLNELSRTQAKVNEASKFSFMSIWPLILALIPVAVMALRPTWLGIAWGALNGLFGRKVS